MPEIILITLAKNLFRILKNEVRNKKNRKGGVYAILFIYIDFSFRFPIKQSTTFFTTAVHNLL